MGLVSKGRDAHDIALVLDETENIEAFGGVLRAFVVQLPQV